MVWFLLDLGRDIFILRFLYTPGKWLWTIHAGRRKCPAPYWSYVTVLKGHNWDYSFSSYAMLWTESSCLLWVPTTVSITEGPAFSPMQFGYRMYGNGLVQIWVLTETRRFLLLTAFIFLCPEALCSSLVGHGCGHNWADVAVCPEVSILFIDLGIQLYP